jgi:O-methyltransferase
MLGLPRGAGYTFTMVGLPRLENIERCAETIFAENVAGDFLEAGVCRGGCTMFMRALQKAYGEQERQVWLADCFDGVPPPTAEQDLRSGLDLSKKNIPQLVASAASVLDNFRALDLLDEKVRVLEGLFADTLPDAPVEKLALLRLDGDLYSSTMETLDALYDRVSVGGFVIVDDYGALSACREAVEDFRARRGIADRIEKVDYTGVFWRKSA